MGNRPACFLLCRISNNVNKSLRHLLIHRKAIASPKPVFGFFITAQPQLILTLSMFKSYSAYDLSAAAFVIAYSWAYQRELKQIQALNRHLQQPHSHTSFSWTWSYFAVRCDAPRVHDLGLTPDASDWTDILHPSWFELTGVGSEGSKKKRLNHL